jgi:hypothetical protein
MVIPVAAVTLNSFYFMVTTALSIELALISLEQVIL